MANNYSILLPRQWPNHIKSAVLNTISLASTVFTSACGKVAVKRGTMDRLQIELDHAKGEIALLLLQGKTPAEVYEGRFPANVRPRFEPRGKWPSGSRCAAPQARVKRSRGTPFVLVIGYLEGRKHLPIVELKRAA